MVVAEISQVLWYIFLGFSVLFGIVMTRKALTKELGRSQREYYLGIAIFIIIHTIARIFYFLYDFVDRREIYWEIAALIGIGSVIFLIYAIERNIFKRTKFLITIITIINLLLIIFLPAEFKTYVQTVNTALIGIFLPLIYIYVAYKSTGSYRKQCLLIAIGILIFLAGQTAHMKALLLLDNIIYFILSPTLMLIGGIIFLYGLVKSA
jgi:hypothetical protein